VPELLRNLEFAVTVCRNDDSHVDVAVGIGVALYKTFRTFIAILRKNLQVLTIHASNTKGFHKRSICPFDL
jgi:hypothetical protein